MESNILTFAVSDLTILARSCCPPPPPHFCPLSYQTLAAVLSSSKWAEKGFIALEIHPSTPTSTPRPKSWPTGLWGWEGESWGGRWRGDREGDRLNGGAVEGSGVLGAYQAPGLGSPSRGRGRQSSEGGAAGRGGGLANCSPAFTLHPKRRSLKSSATHKLAVVGPALRLGWGHPLGPPEGPSPPHPHPHCCSCHVSLPPPLNLWRGMGGYLWGGQEGLGQGHTQENLFIAEGVTL